MTSSLIGALALVAVWALYKFRQSWLPLFSRKSETQKSLMNLETMFHHFNIVYQFSPPCCHPKLREVWTHVMEEKLTRPTPTPGGVVVVGPDDHLTGPVQEHARVLEKLLDRFQNVETHLEAMAEQSRNWQEAVADDTTRLFDHMRDLNRALIDNLPADQPWADDLRQTLKGPVGGES